MTLTAYFSFCMRAFSFCFLHLQISLVHNQISVWFLHLISGAVIVLLNCFCCCCWGFFHSGKIVCHKKKNPFRRDWENCSTRAPLIIFILLYCSGWKKMNLFAFLFASYMKTCLKSVLYLTGLPARHPSERSETVEVTNQLCTQCSNFDSMPVLQELKCRVQKILSGLQWASLFGL